MVMSKLAAGWKACNDFVSAHRISLIAAALSFTAVFIVVKPQQFYNLWLTPDQQGQVLFKLERYEEAARRFKDPRWQAYSYYGAEKFEQSATVFSQFPDYQAGLASANALAQGQHYVKAAAQYKSLIEQDPTEKAAPHNLAIVQGLIDAINMMSESQKAELGEGSEELGDAPQRADGADRVDMQPQEIEQLSAEQLLLDPALNEMWLRQVNKDPASFIAQKFYIQLQTPELESSDVETQEDREDD